MLGDGQQFDMGVAHLFDVRDQPIRELKVTQISVILFGNSRPRPKVNLINTHRLLRPVPRFRSATQASSLHLKRSRLKTREAVCTPCCAKKEKGSLFNTTL